jgi:GPH family glycoside/pentoside/hexuronide:cation symporter
MNAFFPTFLPALLNTVFFFTVGVAGVVEAIGQATGWVAAPIAGAITDRIKFKKARFWPWFIIGGVGTAICWIVVYTIPSVTVNPAAFMIPVAIFLVIQQILAQLGGATGNMMYARIAQDGKLRSLQAMWGKVAREAIRTIVGFVFPILVVVFMAQGMLEHNAWTIIAIILAAFAIGCQCVAAALTRRSKAEQEAQKGIGVSRKGAPLHKTIVAIFTNRALLSIWLANSLLKVFFFYHIIGGFLIWRYYFGNWGMFAAYMTTLSLTSTAGALITPFAYRILKDAKRGAIFSLIGQIAVYAVLFFVMSPESMMPTLVLLGTAMLFNGLSDAFMQPLFAHGADYSVLKSGNKDYGLNMSAFALSITSGILFSTISRTALLARAGYDGATIDAVASNILEGVEGFMGPAVPMAMTYLRSIGYTASQAAAQVVPDGVMSVIRNINTIIPLIICVVIILLLLFVYPLNDKKVLDIQKQIAERDAKAEA